VDQHLQRISNSQAGNGFITNQEVAEANEVAVAIFDIHYDIYEDGTSGNARFYEGSLTVYQFLPQTDRINNIMRDITGAIQDSILPGSTRLINGASQALWGTNLVHTDSAEYENTDTVVALATLPLPGPSGKYKAANSLIKHRKLIKAIVMNASRAGVKLSPAKIAQLERVVTKAGGTLRAEQGMRQGGKLFGIMHFQVEGFGQAIKSRHIFPK
jgi:hypothetical protein